jgi:flavodoxin
MVAFISLSYIPVIFESRRTCNMNALIMYYSKSGTTERLAKRIREALHCEILKVEPEKIYGNYMSTVLRFLRESVKRFIPKIHTKIPILDSYDVVLIGYPLWDSNIPLSFLAFLQKCNLRGKTIIPFTSSGGDKEIECSIETLKCICSEAKIFFPFHYGRVKADYFDVWVSALNGECCGVRHGCPMIVPI